MKNDFCKKNSIIGIIHIWLYYNFRRISWKRQDLRCNASKKQNGKQCISSSVINKTPLLICHTFSKYQEQINFIQIQCGCIVCNYLNFVPPFRRLDWYLSRIELFCGKIFKGFLAFALRDASSSLHRAYEVFSWIILIFSDLR